MSEQLSPGASKVSAIFLGTIVLLITILGVWFWAGQLEESITVAGQMVPEGKLRRVMAPVSGIVTRVMVEENQIVKAGDVLVELDPASTNIERHALQIQLGQLQDEASALRAAHTGESSQLSKSQFGQLQGAWLSATRSKYNADLESSRMQTQRLTHEQQEILERKKQSEEVLKNSEALFKQYQDLHSSGGLSSNDLVNFEQKLLQQRGETRALAEALEAKRLAIEESKQRPVQVAGQYSENVLTHLTDLQQQIAMLNRDLQKNSLIADRQTLVAPIDGVIHQLDLRGKDEVVQAGTVIVSMVPAGTPLVAELKVPNHDMSFIHVGQDSRMALDAFPQFEYGNLFGKVVSISPSTLSDEQGNMFYMVRVKPERQFFEREGEKHSLRSGMTVSANLITRNKNILSFFTEPMLDHLDHAFRDPTSR